MIVVRDLPHLMVEDPLEKLAGKLLLGYQVKGLFHVGDLFRCDLDPVLTQDGDWHIARITVENGEAEGVMKLGVPLGIVGELAQVAGTVGHAASSFSLDCAS